MGVLQVSRRYKDANTAEWPLARRSAPTRARSHGSPTLLLSRPHCPSRPPWTMTRTMRCSTTSSSRSVAPAVLRLLSTDRAPQTQGDAWFKPSEENVHAGVCLRVDSNNFRVFPYENEYLESFEAAVRVLNPVVAVKVRSAAIHAALSTLYVLVSVLPTPD